MKMSSTLFRALAGAGVTLVLLVAAGRPGSARETRPRGREFTLLGKPGTTPQNKAVAAMENKVRNQLNKVRRQRKLRPFANNVTVAQVARRYSRRMALEGFFDHFSPDGDSVIDRVEAAGLAWSAVGENLLRMSDMSDPVGVAVRGWMGSPSHRTNILRRDYTETGVGIWQTNGNTYHFTQVFYAPR